MKLWILVRKFFRSLEVMRWGKILLLQHRAAQQTLSMSIMFCAASRRDARVVRVGQVDVPADRRDVGRVEEARVAGRGAVAPVAEGPAPDHPPENRHPGLAPRQSVIKILVMLRTRAISPLSIMTSRHSLSWSKAPKT